MTGDLPARVRTLISRGRVREQQFTAEQIASLWQKAVVSGKDAELEDLSLEGAIRSAYQAVFSAVLALLAVHELKPGSGSGHHEAAFYAASLLGHEGLEDLVIDSEEIRGLRSASLYDPELASEEDREFALKWMRDTLPAIRAALVEVKPDLAPRMENFSR